MRIVVFTILSLFSIHCLGQTKFPLIPFRDGKLFGYSDISGKMIIPAKYERADFFNEDSLAYVSVRDAQKRQWAGVVNSKGEAVKPIYRKVRIEPTVNDKSAYLSETMNLFGDYHSLSDVMKKRLEDSARALHARVFMIAETPDGKNGLYAKNGNLLLPVEYSSIGFFYYEGKHVVFKAEKGNKQGLFSTSGKWIAPVEYESIKMEKVYENGKYVKKPKLVKVIPPATEMDMLESDISVISAPPDESEQLKHTIYQQNGKYGLRYGSNTITSAVYDTAYWHYNYSPQYLVVKKNGYLGTISLTGTETIPLQYKKLHFLESNYDQSGISVSFIAVDSANRHGVINTRKETLVPFEYDSIAFAQGKYNQFGAPKMYKVKIGQNWGLYNAGSMVMPAKYEDVHSVIYGDKEKTKLIVTVKEKGRWGVARDNGEIIVAPQFDEAPLLEHGFSDGWMITRKEGKSGIYLINDPQKSLRPEFQMHDSPSKYYPVNGKLLHLFSATDENNQLFFIGSNGVVFRK
jgi:hypothetical protein